MSDIETRNAIDGIIAAAKSGVGAVKVVTLRVHDADGWSFRLTAHEGRVAWVGSPIVGRVADVALYRLEQATYTSDFARAARYASGTWTAEGVRVDAEAFALHGLGRLLPALWDRCADFVRALARAPEDD